MSPTHVVCPAFGTSIGLHKFSVLDGFVAFSLCSVAFQDLRFRPNLVSEKKPCLPVSSKQNQLKWRPQSNISIFLTHTGVGSISPTLHCKVIEFRASNSLRNPSINIVCLTDKDGTVVAKAQCNS